MKSLSLFLIWMLSLVVSSNAQVSDTAKIGKIAFFEGVVEVFDGNLWKDANIDQPLFLNQSIRTIGDAIVEIEWNSGVKSTVGPSSEADIKSLLEGANRNSKQETASIFSSFMKIFATNTENASKEEGGIRRSMAEVRAKPSPEEMYWKVEKEITFEEASKAYAANKYQNAIILLDKFISQHPRDSQLKYARFALGHSYVMVNNIVEARDIFENFLVDYPNDELIPKAQEILDKL